MKKNHVFILRDLLQKNLNKKGNKYGPEYTIY